MQGSQLLDIILIAVTGVLLFRLYTVLGRRTGNERQRDFRLGRTQTTPQANDKIAALPDASATASPEARGQQTDSLGQTLAAIKLVDRGFETEKFVTGAKAAYEMIVSSFANGDRSVLRPLVSEEVFSAFDAAVREREQRKEKVSFTFVGFKDVKLAHAELKGLDAEITVAYAAQFISATSNAAGEVIEGDSKMVRDVNDIWTFSRNLRARDPNWTLVATSGELP